MANNLSIESPNFEKINKEAGQFTSDAIALLWAALNDARKTERIDFRLAQDILAPKVKSIAPTGSVDNLDLEGCSVVSFIGSTGVNFTGMRAPETGKSRVVFVQSAGSGTITCKNSATSESANQLVHSTGADYSMTTAKGIIYVYLASRWREVARSG